MKYVFHPDASEELYRAAQNYQSLQENLGFDFLEEIYRGIERIEQFPHGWQTFTDTTRRCLIRRFPFGIIYEIINDTIFIYAIMHNRQNPDYLVDRIDNG